nr:adenosylcobinamide-phosphate synthase CbiB [uncultured Cohaesibacter sp.]
MILFGGLFAFTVLVALLVDAVFGEPDWLWRHLPHPVVVFGKAISFFETCFNHPDQQRAFSGWLFGLFAIATITVVGSAFGYLLQVWLMGFGLIGSAIVAVLSSTLLAQKSLFEHVKRVQEPLHDGNLEGARHAVSMIVGRDTTKLNDSGVARAAIESLAENYSDGIVAPLFWFLLLGLPGLICYKIINTADSMIGHRNERYQYFGWASARLDDLINLVPARLTMLLLLFSPVSLNLEAGICNQPWNAFLADARRHRSPNAGWPEAAMARRLGIALSGPRYYDGKLNDEQFVNADGKREIGSNEVAKALRLYVGACLVQFLFVAIIATLAVLTALLMFD